VLLGERWDELMCEWRRVVWFGGGCGLWVCKCTAGMGEWVVGECRHFTNNTNAAEQRSDTTHPCRHAGRQVDVHSPLADTPHVNPSIHPSICRYGRYNTAHSLTRSLTS